LYGIDEERTLKPRFEKYDKESGSLDSEGLWYGEREVQDEEEEDSDQEEQEQLGLQQEDESETEVFSSSISLFRVLGGSDQ
jgi:hypothetical protein